MSSSSTPVTSRHFDYVAAHTAPEDPFLQRLKSAAQMAGIPPIWISPEQTSCMQILLKLARAAQVVEVGTLAGSSAIALARALPSRQDGGLLRTIEISPLHAAFAREWIARSDVADRIELLRGDAAEVLPGLASDSADAAFLDADKSGYPLYLKECRRIVRTGGMILVDNAFAFGQLFDPEPSEPEVGAVRAFNDLLAKAPGLQSVILPIGDGLWLSVIEQKN